MKRPKNVRCENCVFWKESDDGVERWGACRRYPPLQAMTQEEQAFLYDGSTPTVSGPYEFCGEFRSEWPKEVK